MRAFRRVFLAGSTLALVAWASPVVATGRIPEVLRVGVFADDGLFFGEATAELLNTDPSVRAVALSREEVEAGGLSPFDCVVTRLLGPPEADTPTAETVRAIDRFVASGGGFVGEWWGGGAALSGPAPSYDIAYDIPARFLHLFSGRASDGYVVVPPTLITVVTEHPVVKGLPRSFYGDGGTEYFVRPVPPFDPDLLVLATYDGHGGTNPAIMVGPTGASAIGTRNAVLLFFDARDNGYDPNLHTLWLNSVHWACSPQPSPAN